jgi:hypothetical protein
VLIFVVRIRRCLAFLVFIRDLKLIKEGLVIFFFFVAPRLENGAEFPHFLDQGQSVGFLAQVISSSQGLYLYTNTEKRTHIHKH